MIKPQLPDGALHLDSVSKSFGKTTVLRALSIAFHPGDRVVLLGANGAGKTTLLRIASGLVRPDTGSVFISDATGSHPPLGLVAFGAHHLLLYDRLTVRENLELFGKIKNAQEVTDSLLGTWKLGEFADKQIHELSRGTQRRVALAATLLGDPTGILLDEPSSHLDEASLAILLSELERHLSARRQTWIVIATHDIARFSQFASRFILLDSGKVSRDVTAKEREGVLSDYSSANR